MAKLRMKRLKVVT